MYLCHRESLISGFQEPISRRFLIFRDPISLGVATAKVVLRLFIPVMRRSPTLGNIGNALRRFFRVRISSGSFIIPYMSIGKILRNADAVLQTICQLYLSFGQSGVCGFLNIVDSLRNISGDSIGPLQLTLSQRIISRKVFLFRGHSNKLYSFFCILGTLFSFQILHSDFINLINGSSVLRKIIRRNPNSPQENDDIQRGQCPIKL
ncbi:MAG: hypothetical protein BWY58_00049 [Chloroflexi bacterium ADurb.Bin344]|nr:MAG: hypothetical protein BWY58_00049 [Chloroflexi bacterium ADurb.Bin344]